jgi:hypothetical protein
MSQTTTKEPSKNNDKNTAIYIGVALLLGGGIMYVNAKKKKSSTTDAPLTDINAIVDPATKPIALYLTKVLSIGSKGLEVERLQALMKISADGFFGAQTEAMLYRLKGVKEISLDQYAKIRTINRDVIPNGTKVMVSNKAGANIFETIKKADGTYYSTGKIAKTIPYGQAVGVIRSQSADGNAYTVFYNDFWNGDLWTGQTVGFVSAANIEKYV